MPAGWGTLVLFSEFSSFTRQVYFMAAEQNSEGADSWGKGSRLATFLLPHSEGRSESRGQRRVKE